MFPRESCKAVKNLFCFEQLAKLEEGNLASTNFLHPIGLHELPDCLDLPSKFNKTTTCTESNHHEFALSKVSGLYMI